MARIVWVIALLSATLVLGGCAGIPGALNSLGALGGGYGNAYGGGYGGGCSQGGMPIPYPMAPGYGGGYGAPGMYGQPYYQSQPYGYNNGGYPNQYQAGYPGQQNPQWSADEVNQRLQNQMNRINAGVASGQITPEEAQRLQAEQARIQAAMARMQANGNLNPGELARLNMMLNRSGGDIYRFSHNGTTVPPPVAGTTGTGTGTTVTGTGTTVTGTGTGTTVTGTGTTVTGTGTGTTVTGTGTTVTGHRTTPTGTGTTVAGSMVQPGSSPAVQQRPGGGPMYGQNPQMAGPRMQPNMAGPRFQPRAVQPAAAPRVAPTAGRRVAAVPGR